MSRNKPLPGSRLFLYAGGLIGLVRTAERAVDEAGASTELIDPTTHAESRDINPKGVLLVGVGILLGIWVIVVVLYPLFTFFKYDRTGGHDPAKVLQYLPPEPPPPRNEDHPEKVLQDFRAGEEKALHTYQWVDRGRGLVSIPIDRAIRILAQRGIPPSKPGGAGYYPPKCGKEAHRA